MNYRAPINSMRIPLLISLFFPTLLFAQQTSPGVVTAVQGQAQLNRPTVASPSALRIKDNVIIRDVINTREKSLARILFGGKATVTVKELSRFEVREETLSGGATRSTVDLRSGTIMVNVARQLMKPGDEIQIRTANAVAAVRGSALVVETNGRDNTNAKQITGESRFDCIDPQAKLKGSCPTQDLAELTESTIEGEGDNAQNLGVFPLSIEAANAAVAGFNLGKSVTEEANQEGIYSAAVEQVAALDTAATTLGGGSSSGGGYQQTTDANTTAPAPGTGNCGASCFTSPSSGEGNSGNRSGGEDGTNPGGGGNAGGTNNPGREAGSGNRSGGEDGTNLGGRGNAGRTNNPGRGFGSSNAGGGSSSSSSGGKKGKS